MIAHSSLRGQGEDLNFGQVHDYRVWYGQVFDYVIEQDESGELAPGLAETWDFSDDQLTWTFVIREGVTFHNGDPLTAADVAWSWNRITGKSEESVSSAAESFGTLIESITAEGNEVRVKTYEPQSDGLLWWTSFQQNMAGIVMSQSYFESVGAEEAFAHPIGSAPYMFVSMEGEESAHLTAFLDPDRSDWQKSRTPGFKDLTVLAIPDATTRLAELRTGRVDLAPLSYSAIETVEAEAGLSIHAVPDSNYSGAWCVGLTLNPESPCNDVRVREALNIGIDRESIAANVYSGLAAPSAGFYIGPSSFGYPGDLEAPPYDPDRARQLLDEAGFGSDNPLAITIATYDDDLDFPSLPLLAEAMAAYYVEIGIDATIQLYDWPFMNDEIIKGNFTGQLRNPEVLPVTLFMRGFDNRVYMLFEQFSGYHDGRTGAGVEPGDGGLMNGNQDFPEHGERLDRLKAEFDLEVQRELIGEYVTWMAENYVQVPLLSSGAVFGISDDIASWQPVAGSPVASRLWTLTPAGD